IITLIFGLIHGLGFGRYFSLIVSEDEALVDLLSFALGVEAVQIFIVVGILILNVLFLNILKINKSKWKLVIGAMILSQAIRMIIETTPF
ncbi:HupE/UreJ family protein, partial [Flavobacteriaceae bacterium]|nr:HupE/UreJ family protein [Flavobacteriaceae bacterium]